MTNLKLHLIILGIVLVAMLVFTWYAFLVLIFLWLMFSHKGGWATYGED